MRTPVYEKSYRLRRCCSLNDHHLRDESHSIRSYDCGGRWHHLDLERLEIKNTVTIGKDNANL